MTTVNKSAVVKHSAQNMFDLVDNVNAYSDFLPWCAESIEHERDEDAVKASIVVAASGIRKSFTTLNRRQPGKMLEIRLINGPFRHLEGFWRFDNLNDNGSRVSLDLEFEFSNKLLSLALGPVFHQVSSSMLDAFCQRADEIYA